METNDYYDNQGILSILKSKLKEGGLGFMLSEIFEYIADLFIMNFLFLKPKRSFLYRGQQLDYFYHKYNKTWKNERSIEVPIALCEIEKHKGERILEVGNVLRHYVKVKYDVLDKYEEEEGLIRDDIVDFIPANKYDFIISISTIEHVGIDDKPANLSKAIIALQKMQGMLKDGGKMFVSFPIGYNSALSDLSLMFSLNKLNKKIIYFKKTDASKNIWEEAKYSSVKDVPYSQPVKGVAFLEIAKEDSWHIILR